MKIIRRLVSYVCILFEIMLWFIMVKFVFNSFSTASVKRSHNCTVSGNSGVGGAGEDIADDHSNRNQSDSPARSSAEVVSPSTSIISAKKKMVSSLPFLSLLLSLFNAYVLEILVRLLSFSFLANFQKSTGPKTRSMKASKNSSPSAKEGDIEIEIAEVLFELKKQSQCSRKQEVHVKPSSNQETENSSVLCDGAKSSVTSTTANSSHTAFQNSISLQKNGATSDLLLNVGEYSKSLRSKHIFPIGTSMPFSIPILYS